MAKTKIDYEYGSKSFVGFNLLIDYTHRHYAEQVSKGYRWRTNASLDDVEELKRKYKTQGLESFVGDVAFDVNGKRLSSLRAILTRERK